MTTFPEALIRIAASGSSVRNREKLKDIAHPMVQAQLAADGADDNMERAILLSAAAYSLQQQAGYVPNQTDMPLPTPSPSDDGMVCNEQAQACLQLMLKSNYVTLLHRAVNDLNAYQQHIPYEWIPGMLDKGASSNYRHSRDVLKRLVGKRGLWLAQQDLSKLRKNWYWLHAPPEADNLLLCQEAIHNFASARRENSVAALEQLEAQWEGLNWVERELYLQTLSETLHVGDLPFLEKRLEDHPNSLTVPRLMMSFESHPWSQAAYAAIADCVLYRTPDTADAGIFDYKWSAVFRDDPQYQAQAIEQCHVISQDFPRDFLFAAVPITFWCDRYQIDRPTLFAAAQQGNRQHIFYRLWIQKALSQRDTDSLLGMLLTDASHGSSIIPQLQQRDLIYAAIHWLNQEPHFTTNHQAISFLDAIEGEWDDDLATCFLETLANSFRTISRPMLNDKLRKVLQRYAQHLPLSKTDQFEQTLYLSKRDTMSESEKEQVQHIIAIMTLRQEMIEAIQAGTPKFPDHICNHEETPPQ